MSDRVVLEIRAGGGRERIGRRALPHVEDAMAAVKAVVASNRSCDAHEVMDKIATVLGPFHLAYNSSQREADRNSDWKCDRSVVITDREGSLYRSCASPPGSAPSRYCTDAGRRVDPILARPLPPSGPDYERLQNALNHDQVNHDRAYDQPYRASPGRRPWQPTRATSSLSPQV